MPNTQNVVICCGTVAGGSYGCPTRCIHAEVSPSRREVAMSYANDCSPVHSITIILIKYDEIPFNPTQP